MSWNKYLICEVENLTSITSPRLSALKMNDIEKKCTYMFAFSTPCSLEKSTLLSAISILLWRTQISLKILIPL